MKKDMPLEGLRWSRDSGSALYDTPQNGRSRTGWGGNFLRQITMTFPVNFEMAMGEYVVDMGDMDDFRDRVNQQYPLLKRLRNLTFFPTGNKVLR